MFGISYGELFLLIGATAALVGPKDLPKIARTAGRLAGRAIGYVQMARGQFDNVMQQTQAQQVHKELQDAMAKLDAIRYEVRSLSLVNPGPLTRSLLESRPGTADGQSSPENSGEARNPAECLVKEQRPAVSTNLHSQAIVYSRLAESEAIKAASLKRSDEAESSIDESEAFPILPVSAESTGLLPNRKDLMKGSDILLEAVVEAEVAHKAKGFFVQHENQLK